MKKVQEQKERRGWEQIPVRRVRAEGKTLQRSGSEFEVMIRVKAKKIAAILDTGSRISIFLKSYSNSMRPKRKFRNESTIYFVDVNGKPIPTLNRYKLNTEMNRIERTTF